MEIDDYNIEQIRESKESIELDNKNNFNTEMIIDNVSKKLKSILVSSKPPI